MLSSEQRNAIDRVLMAQVAELGGGAAVAVVEDGAPAFAQGYGLANVEWNAPATPQTIFPIASISKPLTALAVMLLVEDGKLDLDATVDAYLPPIAAASAPITLAHLLSHTSGLRNFNEVVDQATRRRHYAPLDELRAFILALPCDFAPGARWSYSNSGYVVLSYLIEAASGRSLGRFMQERVFEPLGMSRSSLLHDRAVLPQRASDYQTSRHGLERADAFSFSWYRGAGAFASTVNDLARLDRGLAQGRVLAPDLFARMLAPVRLTDGRAYPYGLGWGVSSYLGRPVHHHTGGMGGYRGEFLRMPDERLAVVVLANHADFPFHQVTCALTRVALGVAPVTRSEIATSPAERRAIAGAFRSTDGATLQLRDDDGRLACTGANIASLALTDGDLLFDVRDPETTFALERDGKGDVDAVTMTVPMFAPQRFTRAPPDAPVQVDARPLAR